MNNVHLKFGRKILDFLETCGGPFSTGINEFTEYGVWYCLGSKQYVIDFNEDGSIKYFACFFKIDKNEISNIENRVRPEDLSHGNTMYVLACACTDKKGLAEIRKRLRVLGQGLSGVLWHRPKKADRLLYFPHQKGAVYGF